MVKGVVAVKGCEDIETKRYEPVTGRGVPFT
jgi:hypothetical protein